MQPSTEQSTCHAVHKGSPSHVDEVYDSLAFPRQVVASFTSGELLARATATRATAILKGSPTMMPTRAAPKPTAAAKEVRGRRVGVEVQRHPPRIKYIMRDNTPTRATLLVHVRAMIRAQHSRARKAHVRTQLTAQHAPLAEPQTEAGIGSSDLRPTTQSPGSRLHPQHTNFISAK